MISFTLAGQTEKLAPPGSYPTEWSPRPLYHQVRTRAALHDHPIVINTYNTGTGKTLASLLRLLDLNGQRKNVLFIAPTNELISQHVKDINTFVEKNKLSYTVLAVSAPDLTAMQEQYLADTEVLLRRGEQLYRLLRNPREIDREIPFGHALVMVTNPDIFYYALYFQYNPHDQRNVAGEFIKQFDYIVVDEFHYYSNKQIASFLFAFALFDQLGYFDNTDRRVCLLSATPRENVLRYMTTLFASRFTLIAPTNEPEESAHFDTVPVLAPLQVTAQAQTLPEWIKEHRQHIVSLVTHENQDGAVISSSLARINAAYDSLRDVLDENFMGRITGPEPRDTRQVATTRRLILATPTVDIGYNFAKLDKASRQNIDFVVCDARFRDELIQRIGRAGRVLGKQQVDVPSRATLLLSEEAIRALGALEGQTLPRDRFADYLQTSDVLPAKHQLERYVQTYAIQELFWPLYKLRQMMTEAGWQELDALYGRLCEAFAPGRKRHDKELKEFALRYNDRRRWLDSVRKGGEQPSPDTGKHMADWLAWEMPESGRPDDNQLKPYITAGWKAKRTEIVAFVESQVKLTEALFSFRDAFEGPTVTFYDSEHLFSSKEVNTYDLFHVLGNFYISPPLSASQFQAHTGHEPPKADFYCVLRQHREKRLAVEFVLHESLLTQDVFNASRVCVPIALRGLHIQMREYSGDVVTGGIPYEMAQALVSQSIVMMIVPPPLEYIRRQFSGSEIWPRALTINFADGICDARYLAFVGTAAFEAHAELLPTFYAFHRRRNKQTREQAIIV